MLPLSLAWGTPPRVLACRHPELLKVQPKAFLSPWQGLHLRGLELLLEASAF